MGVIVVTFLLNRALPGDPAVFFAGPAATQEAIRFENPVTAADNVSQQVDEGLTFSAPDPGGQALAGPEHELVASFVALPDDEDEEEKEKLSLPVTGSGNGDLWRSSPEGGKP